MGYINGLVREQVMLFPDTLDDYVGEDNEVRAIAAFIEHLPFMELEFVRAEAAATGRPGYDPRMLLGVFIWGHLNRVRSSRRLEKECGRNVELMWMSGMLKPDFKTLCRFRQDNGKAISGVLTRFRVWCEGADLFGKELVAIDGSKFKAVNNRGRTVTQAELAELIDREKKAADRYLRELEEADAEDDGNERKITAEELKEKIATIEEYVRQQEDELKEMTESGVNRKPLTDPEARMMKTAKGSDISYNVQTAVDSKHKLIVAVEVTNEGGDGALLAKMAVMAKEELGVEELTVVADGGYYGCEAVKACEDENITVYVPIRKTREAELRGLLSRDLFTYDGKRDLYLCPNGSEMTVVTKGVEKGRYPKEYLVYATTACAQCPLRKECTKSKKGRRIKRWVHEDTNDRLKVRMRENPDIMRQRKSIVEHPFGTMKVAMGHDRLLLKGIKNVGTEIKLTVLSYNFKRVISIMGVEKMIASFKTGNPPPQPA